RSPAWRAGGIIGGAQELLVPVGIDHRFLLVPHVIAGGHHIGAGIDRLEENIFGYAETAGGIFAVDDDEIQLQVRNQAGQPFPDRCAADLADHVAQKENSHSYPICLSKNRRPLSVSTASSAISWGCAGTDATSWQSNAMPISRGRPPFA